MSNTSSNLELAIIGGGAAGFFAAANLAEACLNLKISIYESSSKILSKVEISGGGRCNVTHNCVELEKLFASYPRGSNELRGPFSRFAPVDTITWFAAKGVELKTESDGRMFPITDSSQTIIDCLTKCVNLENVQLNLRTAVKNICLKDQQFELELLNGQTARADFVLLASGSTKSGHNIAASFGHTITECAPSLFTFKSNDKRLIDLSGTSFLNSALTLKTSSGKVFKQQGPLLITHWGLSGPAILKLSAFAAKELATDTYNAELNVNWIAEANEQRCIENLSSLRKHAAKREIGSNPQYSLSRRFWERLLEFCGIPLQLHFFELSNAQIRTLCDALMHSKIKIDGKGEFKEEFVTCGGIKLKEVDFRFFESKLVKNLFFAGEILDIDGITGGFNFQAAWTGAWIVAQAIAQRSASRA